MAEMSAESGDLPLEIAHWIDAACDRFESALKAGAPRQIEQVLSTAPEAARPPLLRELLQIEIFYLAQSGLPPSQADYLARFPHHANLVAAAFQAAAPRLEPPTEQPLNRPAAPERSPQPLPKSAPHAGKSPRPPEPRLAERQRNQQMLLAVLALQNGLIELPQLIPALEHWVAHKEQELGQILCDQQVLSADDCELLSALVAVHLRLHGDEPRKSLAALSSLGPLREQIDAAVDDADVHASLMLVGAAGLAADPFSTLPQAVARAGLAAKPSPAVAGTHPHDGATTSDQRFRVLRLHKSGGLGKVFLAVHQEFNRRVALKEIKGHYANDPEFRARFLMEARITGNLEHPGIVPVYSLGQYQDGRPYYVMRFIQGDSLTEAIEAFHQTRPVDSTTDSLQLRKLLGRFIDVCEAIEYAHSRGVLHRDLKPGNIMLGRYGETLVVDWGLAKTIGRAEAAPAEESVLYVPSEGDSQPTQLGTAVGTLPFMSPEQAQGKHNELGPASDVYSLGATLYCLLTGCTPFTGKDRELLRQQVIRGEYPSPRSIKAEIPRALEAICQKAMARLATDRYPSSQHLAADIERWLADEPVEASPETPFQRFSRWTRRHRALVRAAGASAALALVVLGLALWMVNSARQATSTALQNEQAALGQAQQAQGLEKEQRLRAESLASERQEQLSRIHVATGVRTADLGDAMGALPWYVESARLKLTGGPSAQLQPDSPDYQRLKYALANAPQLAGHHFFPELIGFELSPNDSHVVTQDTRGKLTVTNLSTGEQRSRQLPLEPPMYSITVGRGCERILICDFDGRLRLLNGQTLEFIGPGFTFADQMLPPEAFDPDAGPPHMVPSPPDTFIPTSRRQQSPGSPAARMLPATYPLARQDDVIIPSPPAANPLQEAAPPLPPATPGPDLPFPTPQFSSLHSFQLLPDGRHLLIEYRGQVALWDAVAGLRVGPQLDLHQVLQTDPNDFVNFEFLLAERWVVANRNRIVVVNSRTGLIERNLTRAEVTPEYAPNSTADSRKARPPHARSTPKQSGQSQPTAFHTAAAILAQPPEDEAEQEEPAETDMITRPSRGGSSEFLVLPDRVHAIAGSWLYNLRDGSVRELGMHDTDGAWTVYSSVVSPDGRTLVLTNYARDGLHILNLETNTYWLLEKSQTNSYSLAFSRDGQYLAVHYTAADGLEKCDLLDAATGEPASAPLQWIRLPGELFFTELEWLPDGRLAVMRMMLSEQASAWEEVANLMIDVWQLPPRPERHRQPGPVVQPEPTGYSGFFGPGRIINPGNLLRSGQFHTFELQRPTHEPDWFSYVETLDGYSVSLNPDATLGLSTPTPPLDHKSPVVELSLRPGSRYVQTIDDAEQWRLWDRASGKPIIEVASTMVPPDPSARRAASIQRVGFHRAQRFGERRYLVRFSPDESRLVVASEGQARLYSLPSGKMVSKTAYEGQLFAAEFSNDGHTLALAVHTVTDGELNAPIPFMLPPAPADDPDAAPPAPPAPSAPSAQVIPPAISFVAQSAMRPATMPVAFQDPEPAADEPLHSGSVVRLWDAQVGQPLSGWLPLTGRNPSLRFDHTGSQLLAITYTKSDDQSQLQGDVFATPSGQQTAKLSNIRGNVFLDARFSANGQQLITVVAAGGLFDTEGSSIELWNATSGASVRRWFSHARRHERLADLSADGQRIVLAITPNQLQVRGIVDDRPISPPIRTPGELLEVRFAEDDRYVQSLSQYAEPDLTHLMAGPVVPYHNSSPESGNPEGPASEPSLGEAQPPLLRKPRPPAPQSRLWDAASGQAISSPPWHLRIYAADVQVPPINDLTSLARSLAERRIDEVGALIPLTLEELRTVRQDTGQAHFRGPLPPAVHSQQQAAIAWQAWEDGNVLAAVSAWTQLCTLQPQQLAWRRQLALNMVEAARASTFTAAQWEAIEQGLAPAQLLQVRTAENLSAEALVRLRAGDHAGYRSACERLAARYLASADPVEQRWLRQTVLTGPAALSNLARLKSLLKEPDDLALYQLRLGNYAVARHTLETGDAFRADAYPRIELIRLLIDHQAWRQAGPALGSALAVQGCCDVEALLPLRTEIYGLGELSGDEAAPPPSPQASAFLRPAIFRRRQDVERQAAADSEISHPWLHALSLKLLLSEVLDLAPGPLSPVGTHAIDPWDRAPEPVPEFPPAPPAAIAPPAP